MLVADTSRSRAYLQALLRNQLLPNHVMVLGNEKSQHKPGQYLNSAHSDDENRISEDDNCWSEAHFDPTRPLIVTLDASDISYEILADNNVNSSSVIEVVRQRPEFVIIYSGFGGVLLQRALLGTGKKFLHAHGGYLPTYKGSTANYYSLIAENIFSASSLFLSDEIDSGPVLHRKLFPLPRNRRAIDHIYDSGARAKVLIETIQKYIRDQDWNFEYLAAHEGETYFIIHPILKHIAILAPDLDDHD